MFHCVHSPAWHHRARQRLCNYSTIKSSCSISGKQTKIFRALSKQTLILIAVPLIFELSLGALVLFLLSEMNREDTEMVAAAEVSSLTRSFVAYGCERFICLGLRRVSPSPELEVRIKTCAHLANQAMLQLTEMMDSRDAQSPNWEELKRLAKAMDLEGHEGEAAFKQGDQALAGVKMLRFSLKLDRVFVLADQLAKEQMDKQSEFRKSVRERRLEVQAALISLVLVSVALVLGVALRISNMTRKRILTLSNNTRLMAAGKPLSPPITGDEDLAFLDNEFRRLNDQLAVLRRKERAILENAAEVICSLDAKGTIRDINPAAAKLWGLAEADMLGARFASLVIEDDRPQLNKELKHIAESNHEGTFDCRIERKDGTTADCALSVSWSPNEKSYYCVIHDVTEKKEVERMKSDFVAMLSHDLRSPLTAVLMTHEIMAQGLYGELNEAGVRGLARVQLNVRRLMNLVNGLLDIEKIEAGRMELMLSTARVREIGELSKEAVLSLAEQKYIAIDINVDEKLTVCADSERVIQVVINLMSNAIKFSPEKSTITVTAVQTEKNMVTVNVADEGRGIPQDQLDKVFDRFKQVRLEDGRAQKGTGLGLSICKSIVELHMGTIGVRSVEGAGSTFWFTLPATMDEYQRLSSTVT
jgi:PAS domain S-box-containing protein